MEKYNLKITVIAAVALLGMGGILSYLRGQESRDPFEPAMKNLAAAESLTFGVSLDTFFRPSEAAPGMDLGPLADSDIPLRFSGLASLGYPSRGRVTGTAELSASAGFTYFRFMSLTLRLADDGGLYAMVDELPEDILPSLDLGAVNGSWFPISGPMLERLLPWTAGLETGERGPADSSLLFGPLGDYPVLLPAARLEDVAIDGRTMARYEITVLGDGLRGLMEGLTAALYGRPCTDEERAAIARYTDGRSFMGDAIVDIAARRLHTVKLAAVPHEGVPGYPYALTLRLINTDEPVAVPAPDEVRELPEVLSGLLPAGDVEEETP